MRQAIGLLTLLALATCQQQLSPAEKAAKDRSECQAVAIQQSGFDPLTAQEPPRTSPIKAVEALDAVLVLQGHQNGRGWTMVIERATGHLSATLADAEGAFVLAGACTAQ
jgi:hypothetical protein